MAEETAEQLADDLLSALDPVMTRMVQRLGIELTCVILRGLCDRIEQRGRSANVWSDERYTAMTKIDRFARQYAAGERDKAAQG